MLQLIFMTGLPPEPDSRLMYVSHDPKINDPGLQDQPEMKSWIGIKKPMAFAAQRSAEAFAV